MLSDKAGVGSHNWKAFGKRRDRSICELCSICVRLTLLATFDKTCTGCGMPTVGAWQKEDPHLARASRASARKMNCMRTCISNHGEWSTSQEPGGFLQSYLPSPSVSTARSPSIEPTHLPETRSHPLKSGSEKESSVIYYLDDKLLAISRRYEKRVQVAAERGVEAPGHVRGYEGFSEAAKDLEAVIDVVWVTGTRMHAMSLKSAHL